MGKELEFKLSVPDEATLLRILNDEELLALALSSPLETQMKTTYFDTEDRRFSAHHFTLRTRLEGERSVICLKTPTGEAHTRGEWEIEGEQIDDDAIARLLRLGAPQELLAFYAGGTLRSICGAEFLRRHMMLEFPDGSRAELACDCGFLHGQTEQFPLCEAELELYAGEPTEMLALVRRLCDRYRLREQSSSKFARARRLK